MSKIEDLFIYCYCLPIHLLYPNRMKERSFNYPCKKEKDTTTKKKREISVTFCYFILANENPIVLIS